MRCWGETIRSDDGVFAPRAPARIRIGRSLGVRRFRIRGGAACGGFRAVDRQLGRARAGCPCRFRCGVACRCASGGGRGRLTDVIECDARDSGQTYDHECRTDLTNVPPQEATLGVERIRTGGARRPGKAAPRPSATRMTRWPFAVLGGAVLLLAALTFLFQPCGAVLCHSGRDRWLKAARGRAADVGVAPVGRDGLSLAQGRFPANRIGRARLRRQAFRDHRARKPRFLLAVGDKPPPSKLKLEETLNVRLLEMVLRLFCGE